MYHSILKSRRATGQSRIPKTLILAVLIVSAGEASATLNDHIHEKGPKCPDVVEVDNKSAGYNQAAVECVRRLIEGCIPSVTGLAYGLGYVDLRIISNNSNQCDLDAAYTIEEGTQNLRCVVPLDIMFTWDSWRVFDSTKSGVGVMDDIRPYCNEVVNGKAESSSSMSAQAAILITLTSSMVAALAAALWVVHRRRRVTKGRTETRP